MKPFADLLVFNASLWSGGSIRGVDAVAAAGGRILALGPSAELEPLCRDVTTRLDARGATVTPGLADAHVHLVSWALSLESLELSACSSRGEAVARVARYLADHPDRSSVWGRGWDSNRWSEPPDRAALDRVSGDRPVLLHSRDYHNLWVNSAALRAAGIDRRRADPEGGRIERDAAGEPTGLLRENAVALCAELEAGALSDIDRVRGAIRRLHSFGVTSVHDFEGPDALRLLHEITRGPHPRIRVLMHLTHAGLESALALGLQSGLGDDWFRLGGIKLFADGTLGSRSAAMLDPYEGTDERGMELLSAKELRSLVRRALGGRLAVAIHAIGDRACRSSLDAFEGAADLIPRVGLPSRLEHVQLLSESDLPRFARLGVAASMQPVHCLSDSELADRYWGSRTRRSYPWRSLLESGVQVAFGSDAPVESPSVALGLHAAVTRERPDGGGPFVAEQAVSLDAALSAYTEVPARLGGHWPRAGGLRPGSVADLVVWNTDLHRLPPVRLRDVHPVATVLEGEIVFQHGAGGRSGNSSPAPGEARRGVHPRP